MGSSLTFALAALPMLALAQSSLTTAYAVVPITVDGESFSSSYFRFLLTDSLEAISQA